MTKKLFVQKMYKEVGADVFKKMQELKKSLNPPLKLHGYNVVIPPEQQLPWINDFKQYDDPAA